MLSSISKSSIVILSLLFLSPATILQVQGTSLFKRSTDHLSSLKTRYSYTVAPNDLMCRPFGECEPCPLDELHQPFCKPFGNRRLVHCLPKTSNSVAYSEFPDGDDGRRRSLSPSSLGEVMESRQVGSGAASAGTGAREIPAWEACGKVIERELSGYWEFVIINTLILTVSLAVLLVRTNALAASQYRQLAMRIGITGGSAGGGGGN